MFLSADVERGQPDAYDNTLTNETTELNQPIHLSREKVIKGSIRQGKFVWR